MFIALLPDHWLAKSDDIAKVLCDPRDHVTRPDIVIPPDVGPQKIRWSDVARQRRILRIEWRPRARLQRKAFPGQCPHHGLPMQPLQRVDVGIVQPEARIHRHAPRRHRFRNESLRLIPALPHRIAAMIKRLAVFFDQGGAHVEPPRCRFNHRQAAASSGFCMQSDEILVQHEIVVVDGDYQIRPAPPRIQQTHVPPLDGIETEMRPQLRERVQILPLILDIHVNDGIELAAHLFAEGARLSRRLAVADHHELNIGVPVTPGIFGELAQRVRNVDGGRYDAGLHESPVSDYVMRRRARVGSAGSFCRSGPSNRGGNKRNSARTSCGIRPPPALSMWWGSPPRVRRAAVASPWSRA